MDSGAKKYAAYICYSHRDEKPAAWLHRHLERYRIPRGVAPGLGVRELFGRRVGKVFRDREELPAGQPLTPKLYEALAVSDALIVLCSPDAVASRYVNDEIAEFRRLGNHYRIFPVILAGDPPGCYPPALGGTGENLNADMRPGKDGREGALLKVLAGLMRLGPDDLYRRERRAQRRRLAIAIAGSGVFAGIAAVAALLGVQASSYALRAHNTLVDLLVSHSKTSATEGRAILALRYLLAVRAITRDDSRYYDDLVNLYDQIGEKSKVLSEHAGSSFAYSPNGTNIAASRGGNDGGVELWNTATGERVGPLLGAGLYPYSIAFSPDGSRIVMGESENVRLWNAATGREIGGPFGQHANIVMSVAFSPDGSRIASGSYDKTVRVWNAANGQLEHQWLAGGLVTTVVFSPDGRRIAAGDHSGNIQSWNVAGGDQIGNPIRANGWEIGSIAFAPDGQRLVSGSVDGFIRVWDLASGSSAMAPISGHEGDVNSVSFSPDGRWIASGSDDGTVRLWDAISGRLARAPVGYEAGGVAKVAFSQDGRAIASLGKTGELRSWSLDTDRRAAAPMFAGSSTSSGFDFSPDGKQIAFALRGGGISIMDPATRTGIGPVINGPWGDISGLKFLPGGKHLAIGSASKRMMTIIDVARRAITFGPMTFPGKDSIRSMNFSPDEKQVAISVWNGQTEIRRVADGSLVSLVGTASDQSTGISAPDGIHGASCVKDAIRLWDLRTVSQESAVRYSEASCPFDVAFSPNGEQIAVGGMSGVAIWGRKDLDKPPIELGKGIAWSIAFSPDSRRIASSSGPIQIYDTATGGAVGRPMGGRFVYADELAFSPVDSGLLVSSESGGTYQFWSVALLTQPVSQTLRDICNKLLSRRGRRFSESEIANDPVLKSEWPDSSRDVCEGVPGVAPLPAVAQKEARSWRQWFYSLVGWR